MSSFDVAVTLNHASTHHIFRSPASLAVMVAPRTTGSIDSITKWTECTRERPSRRCRCHTAARHAPPAQHSPRSTCGSGSTPGNLRSSDDAGSIIRNSFSSEILTGARSRLTSAVLAAALAAGGVLLPLLPPPPPAAAVTNEQLLFLEAWRAVDRAYVDKGFNGQSWFRTREDFLKKQAMGSREETYAAIKCVWPLWCAWAAVCQMCISA